MKTLEEAVRECESLGERLAALDQEKEKASKRLVDIGRRVFNAIRKSHGGSGESQSFQLGASQYAVSASGHLRRINEMDLVDGSMAVDMETR